MTAQDPGWTYGGGLSRYVGPLHVRGPFPLPLPHTRTLPPICLHTCTHLFSCLHTHILCLPPPSTSSPHIYSAFLPPPPPHHTHSISSSYSRAFLPSSLSSQDTPPNQLEHVSCREGMYVRVVGHLRSFNKQRNMMAFHVRPVEDFNEISHHLSEVIYTHLAVTKCLPVVSR